MKTGNIISPDDNVFLDDNDNDIIIWEENPVPTKSTVEKLSMKFRCILDLSDHSFYMVIDLRKVKIKLVDVEIRAILKKTFNDYRHKLLHGCVIVPNMFMKITAKLILKSYFNSISYHTKMKDALNKINSLKDN